VSNSKKGTVLTIKLLTADYQNLTFLLFQKV
jgi:hypothetical protein